MSTRLLSLEMSTRLLSPSHSLKARDELKATVSGDSLKARDEHKAAVSGDEHKATVSLSFSQYKR